MALAALTLMLSTLAVQSFSWLASEQCLSSLGHRFEKPYKITGAKISLLDLNLEFCFDFGFVSASTSHLCNDQGCHHPCAGWS